MLESTNDKPVQYLFVGYPFSGKTTLSKKLERKLDFARVSIDEVKFDLGYRSVSDDDVPDEAWVKIFYELDKKIVDLLQSGKTILNEYAWLTKKWRDRARNLAQDLGIHTIVIFVDTPQEVVRQRLEENRLTQERFDVPDNIFEEALNEFEKPLDDEDVIIYRQSDSVDDWIKQYMHQ